MPKYIAAFLTMVLLLGGTAQVASAESDISQGQVQEILKEYNDSLQSAYFASNSRSVKMCQLLRAHVRLKACELKM